MGGGNMTRSHDQLEQAVNNARADLAHFEFLLAVVQQRTEELVALGEQLNKRFSHLDGKIRTPTTGHGVATRKTPGTEGSSQYELGVRDQKRLNRIERMTRQEIEFLGLVAKWTTKREERK
jgi:ribosomal protein S10